MKKLLLLLAMFISVASFANPKVRINNLAPWDKPLHPEKVRLDDPYTINYWCLLGGSPTSPPYYLQIYAELNQNPGVRWDVIFDVWGTWYGQSSPIKEFIVTIPSNIPFKLVNFPLSLSDYPNPNSCLYISEGPH